MARIVIPIESQILERLEVRSDEQGTSPQELARTWLEAFADTDARRALAARALLSLAGPVRSLPERPKVRLRLVASGVWSSGVHEVDEPDEPDVLDGPDRIDRPEP